MPRVRFLGQDRSSGIQLDGVTYFAGDEADLSPRWVPALLAAGRVVLVEDAIRVAVPEMEHRDPVVRRKR